MCKNEHLWCKMATIDLNLIRAFCAVHETGSFSLAAQRLGVPRSTVSRAVAALEEALDLSLFHRTTRTVTTTAAGRQLFDRAAPSLAALESSISDLPEREESPSGLLRITSTGDLGSVVLAEAATRFTTRYPGTQVELHLTATVVDLVRDGFDMALRVSSAGSLRDSALIARKVGSVCFQLYAAPSYLARRGVPRAPEELGEHDWVSFRGAGPMTLSAEKARFRVAAPTRVSCDDMFCAREVLRCGGGIGALPSFVADGDVAAGTLARVLPRWTAATGSVFVVHVGRRHVPRKVTAFRELLLELLRQRPLSATG